MKKFLLIIFVFFYYQCWSQGTGHGGFITVSATVPSQMTICGDAKLFTITIYNPSPFLLTGVGLSSVLPTGIQLVPGSLTGATYTSFFGGNILATVPNIPTLTSLTITFMAKAQCNVLQFISGGGVIKDHVTINYTANNISTYDDVYTSTYLIRAPNITITTITNQSHIANIGDVFTRCITIVNGGLGELSAFTFTDIHASGIQITGSNKGVLTNTGLTAKIDISGADFSTIGNGNNVFESGESITICETVHVLDCISGGSSFKAFWGCSVNYCQASVSTANVVFPNYVPNLVITPIPSLSSCLGSGTASPQVLKVVNTGLGQATNVQLNIFQSTGGGFNGGMGSNMDPASFTTQVGIGSTPLTITPTSTQATANLNCMANAKGGVFLTIPTINAGDTVYIKWNSYSCCYNNCTGIGTSAINGWAYKGTYQSICQNSYIIYQSTGRGYSNIYGSLTPDGAPSTLSNGQTGTFNFLFANYGNNYPTGPGARWKFEFTVPTLPCLTTSNIHILKYDEVGVWNPTSVTSSGNVVTATFNGLPPFTLNLAELKIDIRAVCASCLGVDSTVRLSVKSFFIPDTTCGCQIGVSCQNIPFNINCPDPCPAGILFNNFDMSRTSLGKPDNEAGGGNGIPDGSGSLNLAKIKTYRAMFGDTITTTFTGQANTDGPHPSLPYIYASSSISNGNLLSFLDASLLIFRGGSLFATCNTGFTPIVTTSGTTRIFTYDLSVPTLISNGCVPAGFVSTNNDSLIFKPRYKVSTNVGNGVPLNCYSTNQFYSSNIANPTLASDEYQCGHVNGNVTITGYFYANFGPDTYNTQSCNNVITTENYYLSLGLWDNNSAGGNFFPYEYRNWAHIKELTSIIPNGYTYISARFRDVRTAGTLVASASAWIPLTPNNPNSDTLVFPVEQYFSGYGGTIPLSDDGFNGTLEVTIEPSCKVSPSVYQPIKNNFRFSPTVYLTGPGNDTTFIATTDDQIIYDPPALFVQSSLPSILALTNTASWDVIISNTSNVSNAINTWLSGPTITGVSIIKVVDLGTTLPISPVGDIYKLGTVNAGGTRTFRVTATYTSCLQDSVIVYSGWNCAAGYPTSVSNYPCTPQKIRLTLTPQMPALFVDETGPNTSIQLCDTATFVAQGIDLALGSAYHVTLTSTLPTGLVLVPGSSKISYPISNPYISISDPTLVSGNTWKWDISASDSLIGANGLNGVLDTILNKFNLKFKITTDCGFISGSNITSILAGKAACGQDADQYIFSSTPLDITGATNPYNAIIKLTTGYLSPCASQTTMKVIIVNGGPAAFGNTDSVIVKIPAGVSYVTGSFAGIRNAPSSGVPHQLHQGGDDYLSWKLPFGVVSHDSTVFSFGYSGTPEALACGIVYFGAKTISVSTVTCSLTGASCTTDIITGDTSLAVFTYKAYLSLSNAHAVSVPHPPGGETVTVTMDITNTGQAVQINADSLIQFFYDTNGDSIYSPGGDVFLAQDTVLVPKDSTITYIKKFNVPAGKGCSIIAVVDPTVNFCVCLSSELFVQPILKSLGNDTTLCSRQTLQLETAPVTGYTYSWSPGNHLNDSTIANPILTASNITNAPISTTYILTTNRINCTSTDTITIKENPLPISNAGVDIDICPHNPGQVGVAATAGYIYRWSPITGVSDTALSNPTITLPVSDTSIYIVTTTHIGCSLNDSVTVRVNSLPTATITGTIAVCKNDPSPAITYTGATGTSPYTFTYTINGVTQPTLTTITGDTITIRPPTNVAGTFKYSLVSVKDASAASCLNLQTDSVKITVNPLPIATIAGTIPICKDALPPNITFVGSAGTSPYTFTYTINGGTSQTVSSIASDSAMVAVPTDTTGVFIYTLVSVQDASSTACTQAQTGNATVTIDPLPTASIVGNATVCEDLTTPAIYLLGHGGIPPYTFAYQINGVLQPTVISTSGDTAKLTAPTNSAGTFSYVLVSVKDSNATACTHPQAGSVVITVNPKPVIAFSSNKVCNGNNTVFNDSSTTSTGTIVSRVWNFGDSSALNTTTNPTYMYINAGVYHVKLIETNNFGCIDSITKPVRVYFNPVVNFNHTDVCLTDTMHFLNTTTLDTSSTIASYLWVFGDGSPTNNTVNPSHYYSTSGTYNVTLVATTNNICSAVANISVKDFDPPHTNFTLNNTCLSDSALFMNTSTNPSMGTIASWTWNYGDVSPLNSTVWSPDHLYSNPGHYQVTLITRSSNLGCADTLKDSIVVFPLPVPNFGFNDLCAKQTLNFHDSSSISIAVSADSVTQWSWNFGDASLSSTLENPPHIYANPGTYSASLIATSVHGCKDTVTKNIIVHPLPHVQYKSMNVCAGNTSYFNDSSTILSTDVMQSWNWNFGDNATSVTKNTSHLYGAAGTYQVKLIVTSAFGCVDSLTKPSVINPNPVVQFYGSDTIGCKPLCVSFRDTSSIITGANVAWTWTFGDNNPISTSHNIRHCYGNDSVSVPVSFTTKLTVTSDSGCVSSLTKNNYITVFPKPTANFSVAPTTASSINPIISFTDLSTGSSFWNWNFGDHDTSIVFAPKPHSYADTGKYVITLIASNAYSCLDTTHQTIVIEPDFVFYIPNAFSPNDDGINDTFTGKGIFIKDFEMMIFDRWGNLIFYSNDINKPWDGRANYGKKIAQRDVYVYMIKVTDIKSIEHSYRGTVTLVD
jgi:gliding motility-associated-like protein/uncharacterized repeat protein (TIGR01451 family)